VTYVVPPNIVAGTVVSASGYLNPVGQDIIDLNARTSPSQALVATDQSTTSTTYTDLATIGPAVTLVTGTLCLVLFSSNFFVNGAAGTSAWVSVGVSGATTIAANDSWGIRYENSRGVAQNDRRAGFFWCQGLNPGSNTFTLKYNTAAGTSNFHDRYIVAWPANNLA
jgi:hypothetical protein